MDHGQLSDIIEKERLIIEPFSEKRLTLEYVNWLNNSTVVRYSEQRHLIHTIESCRQYLKSFENSPNFFWAIVSRDPVLKHIGNMNAYVDPNNCIADLGILIGKTNAWGKGYATEAWLAVCRFLFVHCQIRKITAGCLSTNHPMLKLMQGTGMVEDGRRKRHFMWEGLEVDILHVALFPTPGAMFPNCF